MNLLIRIVGESTQTGEDMRFRIPNHLKETVTIVRQSAFERDKEMTIATDIACMIIPGSDLIRVDSGVPMGKTGWEALLEKPNTDIVEGDILRRSDNTELEVHRVRPLGITMILELKDDDQRIP